MGKWYLAEMPADTRVWKRTPPVEPPGCGPLGRPRLRSRVAKAAPPPERVDLLVKQLPRSMWKRYTIKEGSKGPLLADFAFLRIAPVQQNLPGPRQWLVLRRNLAEPAETKFYLSNAPARCAPSQLVRVSGLRWPIETALKEGKGEVGMDHYETRTWLGWHHHMAQTFMAHLFLTRLQLVFKKSPALTIAQSRRLIAQAIQDDGEAIDIVALIDYRQWRNRAAYRSHRNRARSRSRRR